MADELGFSIVYKPLNAKKFSEGTPGVLEPPAPGGYAGAVLPSYPY
jgi:hypothetical protein